MNLDLVFKELPLKEMDGSLLALSILREVQFKNAERVTEAMELASYLHRGATRANRGLMPRDNYITHPLRNTLRLIRWGVKDIDVLVASLLHDTVEDCPEEILTLGKKAFDPLDAEANVTLALDALAENFGPKVRRILSGVTNPVMPKGLSRKEKHALYREHVVSEIQSDPDVLLVKLADFIDNAGSLHHNLEENPGMVKSLASKYFPLVEPLKSQLEKEKNLPRESLSVVLSQLERISDRLGSVK